MNFSGLQILALLLLANPDTTGVRLPTLQLGEFVIYGIDTLHLRRQPISLRPEGMYLPIGPRPEFQVDKLLRIEEIPVSPIPRRLQKKNPLVGMGYFYLGTFPTGSGRFALSGPLSNRLNIDLSLLKSWTNGHIKNAKERIEEGRLKLSYSHQQFSVGLASLFGQNYFGYFLIDSTTSGFRRIAQLKLNSSVHYSEQFLLGFSAENISITQYIRTQYIRKKYQLTNRNTNLRISGVMESGPFRAILFNAEVIHRSSEVKNSYLPDSIDTSATALQVMAGLRDIFGKFIFIGQGGLSISYEGLVFPVATVRVTIPFSKVFAAGAQLGLSREVDSLYIMSRFILPENFTIERRRTLTVFTDYEFNNTKLNLDLMFMDRKDATVIKRFPQSSQLEKIMYTTLSNFDETRISASLFAHLNILTFNANLQYSVFDPDSTLIPNLIGNFVAKVRLTPNILASVGVKVFDKFSYTTVRVIYNWNRMVSFALGARNIFDQPNGWIGYNTGGRRELFFDLNLTKEVIP